MYKINENNYKLCEVEYGMIGVFKEIFLKLKSN